MDLYDYEALWTTAIDEYALFASGDGYIIIEKATGGVIRIEDPDIAAEVKYNMVEAGVEIVED